MSERRGEPANLYNSPFRFVDAANVVATPEEINKVPSGPTTGIQNSHPWSEPTLQELIEQVDVDASEPLLQILWCSHTQIIRLPRMSGLTIVAEIEMSDGAPPSRGKRGENLKLIGIPLERQKFAGWEGV